MGFAKIPGKLTSRIGSRVNFSPPSDVRLAGGVSSPGEIIDEVWVDEALNRSRPRRASPRNDWGDYSFCAQLIQWEDGQRMIRLAYYRRRAGENHWEFASQMTVCSEPETVQRLCKLTLGKKSWFKPSRRKKL